MQAESTFVGEGVASEQTNLLSDLHLIAVLVMENIATSLDSMVSDRSHQFHRFEPQRIKAQVDSHLPEGRNACTKCITYNTEK